MKIRGQDDWGAGHYGASRGSRRHNGVDVVNSPGDAVKSLTYGTVTKVGWCYGWKKHPDRKHLRYVQVTLDGNDCRYFYCKPTAAQGDKIKPGDELGIAHDLNAVFVDERKRPMTQHYHLEIIGTDGEFVNPADMIPEIKEATI